MFKRSLLAAAAVSAVAVAACSSGGGNVTGGNPLNPTSPPSGVVSTTAPTATPTGGSTTAPTATPTSGSTTAPTATPTAGSTTAPTATPTAGSTTAPTASPTAVATVAPTTAPTATATATSGGSGLATTCATATGSPGSMVYTLPGTAETIALPNYPAAAPYQVTGSSDVPSQSPSGTQLTIKISQNSFDSTSITPSGKTVDFYTTLEENTRTTFGNGSTSLLIPVTLNSPCIVAGRTYTVDEASSGLSIYTETDTPTAAGSVTGHIQVSLNPFPANTLVDITISH